MNVAQARAIVNKFRFKPNGMEQDLLELLNHYFSGSFIFNGGQVLIEGKVPDYLCTNGKKVLIEFIGYKGLKGHSPEDSAKRITIFNKYGFRTLCLYEEDLKDEKSLAMKVAKFIYEE